MTYPHAHRAFRPANRAFHANSLPQPGQRRIPGVVDMPPSVIRRPRSHYYKWRPFPDESLLPAAQTAREPASHARASTADVNFRSSLRDYADGRVSVAVPVMCVFP